MARVLSAVGRAFRETGLALDRVGSSLQGNFAFREERECGAGSGMTGSPQPCVPRACLVPVNLPDPPASPCHCSEPAQDAAWAGGQEAQPWPRRFCGAQRSGYRRRAAGKQCGRVLRQRDQG